MSSSPTQVTEEIYQYLRKNFSSEDDFLKNLKKEANEAGIPEICISEEQGKFLQVLLKSIRAKYVLEIGSLAGYSAITMARALPEDGKLVAVEISSKNAEFIEQKALDAGLSHKIEVVNADAKDFLGGWQPDFKLDFVFVDADKKGYKTYFELCTPLIRKGGIFAADNALGFGHIAEENPKSEPGNVKAIQDLNQTLKNSPLYESCLVTVGDGMAMGLKL
ncbi:O-methyltransferase [bacterium]|nr:MAG: O-methyltransferase [bacterium]